MKRSVLCTAAAFALLTTGAFAQTAKPAGEGAQAPAGGAEGGEHKLPPGGAAPKTAPGAGTKMPGAPGGAASPGMKGNQAAEPQPGQRQQGEAAGTQSPKAGTEGQAQRPANANGQAESGQTKPGGAAAGKAGGSRPAPKLTEQQSTRVKTVFRDVHVRPVHVDFNVNVGVAVPRTVVLEPVPPTIISIVPGYEGYRFFVVPGEIVIVDPVSLEIVDVLPI